MLHRSGFRRLTRLDVDGWTKEFANERLAKQCVFEHICENCREDYDVDSKSTMDEMLSTACGMQFMYERNP